jgi:transketolase
MHNSNLKKNYITSSFTDCLIKLANKKREIILLDADLSDDANLKKFAKKFPKRFIQNGIAEQDMVSMAGGLALMGLLPVVNSYASFLTARANEQIYNNSTECTKIIYMCLYAGILPAGAGKSHQSLRDISLLSSIPNMKIYHPYNFLETKEILKYCVNKEKNNCAIRLSIGPPPLNLPELPKKYSFVPGEGTVITNGSDGIIFSYGQTMMNEAYKTHKELLKKNIKLKLVNMPCINNFNRNWLKKIIGKIKYIFFLEDHNINGGMSDLMISFITSNKILNNCFLQKFAPNEFPACGTPQEVLKYHRLDHFSLATKIKKILKNNK